MINLVDWWCCSVQLCPYWLSACLDLSSTNRQVLKSQIFIVSLSISPCNSIRFFLTYFDALLLGAYILRIFMYSQSQFSHSVVSDSLRPMDHSMPGFPVHHQLPKPAQTHVHWVGDAIQPSHYLSSPSVIASKLSQHQGLSQWVSLPHHVAKVLELQLQHQSFQWIFRTDLF